METKLCNGCNQKKNADEFSWANKSKGYRHSQCKTCVREYQQQHYKENKKDYLDRHKARQQEMKEFARLQLTRCIDCGETDKRVLEFDHILPVKHGRVIEIAGKGYSKDTILDEIERCEVRCANCHAIRHYEERHGSVV